MSFDFKNDIPIYMQIIEHIKLQIISKKYIPNQKIPSVRELSLIFEVNPNTIVKALQELENFGLIYTDRTNGKFVTGDENLIKKLTDESIDKMVSEFFSSMEKIGLSKSDVLDILSKKS